MIGGEKARQAIRRLKRLGFKQSPHLHNTFVAASYFTAETLHVIEQIKLHRQSFADKREVAVAEYA